MRALMFLSLTFPFFSNAQINRSAREFATGRIEEYIVTKLFKDMPYKPVSFGELKTRKENDPQITWTIEHTFEITETREADTKKAAIPQPHKFVFYLDNKMKVLRAESFYSY
jgi:hypothetical protein